MQALVYTFIALAATALGAVAYFGLTFTPAEAILAAVVFGCVCVVLLERSLRQRAESRLEKAIEDLSRLLATDAQAGAVLGQRINAIADINAEVRIDSVEADISVLGTVIRQVAEAVADIEDRAKAQAQPSGRDRMIAAAPPPVMREPEPTIPLELLRQGIEENRLIYHIQPVVTLPQRRPQGYDLVPRLRMQDGDLADRVDFMPRRGGEDVLRHIEGIGMVEAITISRRARTGGQPITLYVPLSRATLGDSSASEQMIVTLEANRAIAAGLIFAISENDWQGLTTGERAIADAMVKKGAGFSVTNVRSLRIDVAEMAAQGVRSLRIDAGHFIAEPQAFTDFHASDIANYIARFDIKLLATGITNERQIVELLEDGIVLVQGPHIAAPGPVRADLVVESSRQIPQLRRAEY
ncbi:EAL domain-containing protein [Devosia psychrophila]|uniref:Cyclic-di-GMP phosphodiesterase, flagellum assembly factor TipF n=1 Tax=Devosia psychrophila TaxID=728005 RepID=A0A1I1HV03_9HYPH|nr:EAL domain-containing protein [Devosia psychrophila]SFC27979.1 cyclic-di-GMP phosphodiesterase, flagellum assembly factor TipF [Devosia psychrophila]